MFIFTGVAHSSVVIYSPVPKLCHETHDLHYKFYNYRTVSRAVDPDPDPDWIRIQLSLWIRIRNPDPDPGGRPTKIGKSEEISCFEELDVLFGGLKASPAA